MVGMGRSPGRLGVIAVTSVDPVLSLISALALGQTAGSALVVDLCRDLSLRTTRTLSDLLVEGPSLAELSPGRSGVALIGSGPITVEDSQPVIEALAENWPAIVVRCHPGQWPGRSVPVRPLFPGFLEPVGQSPAVWQPVGSGARPPGPGPVLPRVRSALVRRMLSGRAAGRSRWVRAWEPIWGMPWA